MRRMQKVRGTLGAHGAGHGSANNQAKHTRSGLLSQQLATAPRTHMAWLAAVAWATGAAARTSARYEPRELWLLAYRIALTNSATAACRRVARAAFDRIVQLLAEAAP
jgi:hypothetical protein